MLDVALPRLFCREEQRLLLAFHEMKFILGGFWGQWVHLQDFKGQDATQDVLHIGLLFGTCYNYGSSILVASSHGHSSRALMTSRLHVAHVTSNNYLYGVQYMLLLECNYIGKWSIHNRRKRWPLTFSKERSSDYYTY